MEASVPGVASFTRDVKQGYVQSRTELKRLVHIEVQTGLGIRPNFVLPVLKYLYGSP